jgi:hypothetical protein
MEMGRSGNGGRKVVTFDDAITGMRRNGSLSSYLDMGRAAPRPLPAISMGSRRRTYADGELDVFSAERYFKGAMDGDGDRKEGASVGVITPAVAVQVEPLVETAAARPPPATEAVVMTKPSSTTVSFTASSAFSANSQTALFGFGGRLRPRRSSRDSKCCVQVGVLMRTCSGKRSVRVDGCAAKEAPNAAAEPAATGIDWYKELRMRKAALGLSGAANRHDLVAAGLPPSLNLGTAKVAAIGREVTGEEEDAETTFPGSMKRRIRSNFTLLAPVRANVEASGEPGGAGKGGEPGGAGKGGRGGGGAAHHLHDDDDDDDAGSESSSDLFEIKSLAIGDCPYEPSEASIQWSVVTASAADASERGDRVPARWVSGGGTRQLRGHRPPGLLAGCASHRAVDVSAAAIKAVPNAVAAVQQRRSEGFRQSPSGA